MDEFKWRERAGWDEKNKGKKKKTFKNKLLKCLNMTLANARVR